MRSTLLLLLLLAGCPTPPESPGAGGGNPGGPPGGPGAGGGPGGPGGGPEGAAPPPEGDAAGGAGGAPAGGVLIVNLPDGASPPTPKQTQAQVKAGSYVTFSGTISCATCDKKLVVSVSTPAPEGTVDVKQEVSVLTRVVVDKAGDFSVAVPKGSDPVVLEVLYDEDGNGAPTSGERFAVVPPSDDTVADEDRKGLVIDLDGAPQGSPQAGAPPEGGTPPEGGAPPAGGPEGQPPAGGEPGAAAQPPAAGSPPVGDGMDGDPAGGAPASGGGAPAAPDAASPNSQ